MPLTYVRAPKRARQLALDDHVLVDGHNWRIAWLAFERGQAHGVTLPRLRVRARPSNPEWPGPDLLVGSDEWATVLVDAEQVPTPRPHVQRITAHAPVQRGWYRDPGGYDVGCACGWQADQVVHTSRVGARSTWVVHKAQVISALLAVPGQYYAPTVFLVELPRAVAPVRYRLREARRG